MFEHYEHIRLLAAEVIAHKTCGSTMELLVEMQSKLIKDYVPKKEILELKTEQERKISKLKLKYEKKLYDLNMFLSEQVNVLINIYLLFITYLH